MATDLSGLIAASVAFITDATKEANALAERISNAGNVNVLIQEIRENSDDQQLVKFRAFYEAAMLKINEQIAAADKYIVDAGLVNVTPVDIEAATAQYKAAALNVKNYTTALKNIPGAADSLVLPELRALPGAHRGAQGVLGPRPRITRATIDGTPVSATVIDKVTKEAKEVTNMTVVAAALSKLAGTKVEVASIRDAAFAEAGTTDFATLDGKPIGFVLNVNETNYSIQLVPAMKS